MYFFLFLFFFFFFNDTATTEIYTLSLHDALPIRAASPTNSAPDRPTPEKGCGSTADRKSTRLNSSHGSISYAVFCLKKKNTQTSTPCACKSQRARAGGSDHPPLT